VGLGEGAVIGGVQTEAQREALAAVILVASGVHAFGGRVKDDSVDGEDLAEIDLDPGRECGVGHRFGAVRAIRRGGGGRHAFAGEVGIERGGLRGARGVDRGEQRRRGESGMLEEAATGVTRG